MNPTTRIMAAPHRSGIALILAIVILSALMLMGLPFLYSQSAGLSGARIFRDAQRSALVADTATRLAAAVAIYAVQTQAAVTATIDEKPAPSWTSLNASHLKELLGTPFGDKPDETKTAATAFSTSTDDNRTWIDFGLWYPDAFPRPDPDVAGSTEKPLTYTQATIEDESGKLDPNTMSVAVWDGLLKVLNIPDWDDDLVIHGRGGVWYDHHGGAPKYSEWNDNDGYGELARALSWARLGTASKRLTSLEQLLSADVGQHQGNGSLDSPGTLSANQNWPEWPLPKKHWQYDKIAAGYQPTFGLRRPLTRVELDRVRPYLTLHQPRIGREGKIDLGTVVTSYRGANTYPHLWIDGNEPPWGWGTVLRTPSANGRDERCGFMDHHFRELAVDLGDGGNLVQANTPVSIDAPSPININAASNVVLKALGILDRTPQSFALPRPDLMRSYDGLTTTGLGGFPAATTTSPLFVSQPSITSKNNPAYALTGTNIYEAGIPGEYLIGSAVPVKSLWLWTDPLAFLVNTPQWVPDGSRLAAQKIELPPLSITSSGIVTVESEAVTIDAQGHTTARRRVRTTIQAVPQDQPIERRWVTQGQMHVLLTQRWGSNMDSWPVATRRVQQDATKPDTFPADTDPDRTTATVISKETSVRSGVLPSMSGSCSPNDSSNPIPDNGTLNVDWRVSFGGDPLFLADPQKIGQTDYWANDKTKTGQLPVAVNGGALPAVTDLRPDGLYVKPNQPVAYAIPDDPNPISSNYKDAVHGPFRRTDWKLPTTLGNTYSYEMAPRHLSFCVRPEKADWTGIVPLLDVRMPTANVANMYQASIDGGTTPRGQAASNALENRLGLYFDASSELLVLIVAPPGIEHTVDSGAWVPWDDPATSDLDERSLGLGFGSAATSASGLVGLLTTPAPARLAPRTLPLCNPDGSPGGVLASVSRLIKASCIVHLWSTKSPATGGSTKPFFRQGVWHQIDIMLGSTRPGCLGLMVDGIVGSDVLLGAPSTSGTGAAAITQLGDHCTLPALPLLNSTGSIISGGTPGNSPFPIKLDAPPFNKKEGVQDPITNGIQLQVTTITVGGLTVHGKTITAADLFPERGMIRIDDEYILYSKISGNDFQSCVRAQRQNTNTRDTTDPHIPFPNPQVHLVNSLVVPAGYRFAPPKFATIYRGGCTLTDPFPSGDPGHADTGYQYCIWFALPNVANKTSVVDNVDKVSLDLFGDPAGPRQIPIDPAFAANLEQFPENGGVVRIGNLFYAYTKRIAGVGLDGVVSVTDLGSPAFPVTPPYTLPWPGTVPPVFNYLKDIAEQNRAVVLISLGVNGSPKDTGRYCVNPNSDRLIQLQDSTTGRIEWLQYASIVTVGDRNYFLSPFYHGWYFNGDQTNSTRGCMRTDFVGRKGNGYGLNTHLTDNATFPAGSQVIPVQTEIDAFGHVIATGDVITLLPKTFGAGPNSGSGSGTTPSSGTTKVVPCQVIVRYAAMDGYSTPGVATDDVKNEYFAFDAPIPDDSALATDSNAINYEFICGNAWGAAKDLTSLIDVSPYKNIMGQLDSHQILGFYMPRLDLWAENFNLASKTAKVVFCGVDKTNVGSESSLLTTSGAEITIDAIAAGRMPAGNQTQPSLITAWMDGDATKKRTVLSTGITTTDLSQFPVYVTTGNLNDQPFVNNTGLIVIGGEVFAYQRAIVIDGSGKPQYTTGSHKDSMGNVVPYQYITTDGSTALLIGRGLLGSVPVLHQANEPYQVLPIAPVAVLAGMDPGADATSTPNDQTWTFADQTWFRLDDGTTAFPSSWPNTGVTPAPTGLALGLGSFKSQLAMVCQPDGTAQEVVQIYGSQSDRIFAYADSYNAPTYYREFITAPWTRQLYNSTKPAKEWQPVDGSSGSKDMFGNPQKLKPIVIGWWPRYRSGYPNTWPASYTATNQQAALRSRAYGWMGFPHGLVDACFDPTLMENYKDAAGNPVKVASMETPTELDVGTKDLFRLCARALPSGNDWTIAKEIGLDTDTVDQAFNYSSFIDVDKRLVGGAELRLYWKYLKAQTPPGSSAIQQLSDITTAGNATPPPIGPMRLRCLAPTKILATEVVR